jgi:glycolate oxidase FAD binding subunit
MSDTQQALVDAVRAAAAARRPLCIRGGGSKDFYGLPAAGEPLDVRGHAGIVAYEPTELVVTARCGTPLAELEAALSASGQMLAFEPPHFGGQSERQPPHFGGESERQPPHFGGPSERQPPRFSGGATIGGMVAAGLSGPRRPSVGALRDFLLGVTLLDGHGEVLRFGGQVMKNVAGYDVSRVMAGGMGTLGIILEVSLKTLPRPAAEETLQFEMPEAIAIETLNRWAGQPLPLSASAWSEGELHVRLSGAALAVAAAREKLGGQRVDAAAAGAFWSGLREQTAAFFENAAAARLPLWRLSLPSTTPAATLDRLNGARLIEWGGALRWVASGTDAVTVRELAAKAGGHATLFRADADLRAQVGVFQPLAPAALAIHRRLKAAFDPQGLLNPGRLYAEF